MAHYLVHRALACATLALIVSPSAMAADAGMSATDVKTILREKTIPASKKAAFDAYFTKTFLPQFIKPTKPFSIDDLPGLRKQLKIFLLTGKNGAAHDRLNELTLAKMKEILKGGPYGDAEPAIKYNALLVIADLNQDDDSKSLAPLPATLPVLIDAFQSPKQPDYLKSAALIGLARFAEAGDIPKDKTPELTKNLLALLKQTDPPPGRTASAHNYLRRSAGQVLAAMGSPGPENSVLAAFEGILSDPKTRPTLRCDMAQFIGDLKFPASAKNESERLAKALGQFMVEVCRGELDRAESQKKNPSRRMIMYALYSGRIGIQGLPPAEDSSSARTLISGLNANVGSLYKELDNPDTDDGDVANAVDGKLQEMEKVLTAAGGTERGGPLAAADKKAERPARGKAK